MYNETIEELNVVLRWLEYEIYDYYSQENKLSKQSGEIDDWLHQKFYKYLSLSIVCGGVVTGFEDEVSKIICVSINNMLGRLAVFCVVFFIFHVIHEIRVKKQKAEYKRLCEERNKVKNIIQAFNKKIAYVKARIAEMEKDIE